MVSFISADEIDSGVDSMPESCKDLTPEKMHQIEDDLENEEDETIMERLIGLTEMFPESIRNATYHSVVGCKNGLQGLFSFSKSAAWIFFSTSTILFAPLLFEIERVQIQTAQLNQQKQVLLGPSTAMTPGSFGPGMPSLPPPSR